MQCELLEGLKPTQRKLIFRQSKESSSIFKGLKTMAYGILEIQISLFMLTQMQIGPEVWMTGKAQVVVHSSWVPD